LRQLDDDRIPLHDHLQQLLDGWCLAGWLRGRTVGLHRSGTGSDPYQQQRQGGAADWTHRRPADIASFITSYFAATLEKTAPTRRVFSSAWTVS
jgi:hypothetical protein